MSRIPFSSDDADDIGSLTGNKITVSDSKVRLQVGTGDLEVLDGRIECKAPLKVASAGITFSDGTLQTSKGEEPLTFSTGVNLSLTPTPGSILRSTNQVVYTPPTLNAAAVGLGNVNNTSDSAKPVSTLQQAALDDKANLSGATFTGSITGGVLSIDDRIRITSSLTQPWISKIHNLTFKAWTKADGTEASEAGTTTGTKAETFKISSYNDANQFVQYQCKGHAWFDAYTDGNVQFKGHRYNCFLNGYGASLVGGKYGTEDKDYFTIFMGPNDNYPQLRFMRARNGPMSTLVAGTWYYHSDDRLKHNEQVISNALSTIRLLSPQTYDKSNTLTDASNTYVDAGFIAQEVAQIPELAHYVHTGTDTEIWHLNYTPLFTYAVAGLKELDAIVQSQQTEIFVCVGGWVHYCRGS